MQEKDRGRSDVTSFKDLKLILQLAEIKPSDIFCDLGCGKGNLCRWASKRLKYSYGIEESKRRYKSAKANMKKFSVRNATILNHNFRLSQTLRKLRQCTIFYCTFDEDLGFFKKFQDIVKPKTRLITYYLPPYPIMANSFEDWFYLMVTPFSIAKNKTEWLKSVTKKGSFNELVKDIKRDFEDHEERILDLEESLDGINWITKSMNSN